MKIFIISFIFVISMTGVTYSTSMNHADIFTKIEMVAEKSGESPMALSTIIAEVWRQNQLIEKSGLGILNDRLFLDLNTNSNRILHGSEIIWTGGSINDSETVFILGDRVFANGQLPQGSKPEDLIVVIFNIDKVYILNLKKFSGGYYLREGNTHANQ